MPTIREMNIFTKTFKDVGETHEGITTEIYENPMAIKNRESVSVDTCWQDGLCGLPAGYETAVIRWGHMKMTVLERVFKSFGAAHKFHERVVANTIKKEEARIEREMWARKYHKG